MHARALTAARVRVAFESRPACSIEGMGGWVRETEYAEDGELLNPSRLYR